MGLLDDAIREHMELKRRSGAAEDEATRPPDEALSADAPPVAPVAAAVEPPAPDTPKPEPPPVEPEPEPVAAVPPPPFLARPEPEPWLDEPDEVPAADSLDHPRPVAQPTTEFSAEDMADAHGDPAGDYVTPDEEVGDDLLEETPEFLQETPEHDRLWFEQKPPRDFDFGA